MSEIKSEESKAESKIGYIYSFTFPNGKQYIGQTSRSYENRWREHKCDSNNSNKPYYHTPLYRAIRKYGWDTIVKDVICLCNIEQLNDMECLYIERCKTLHPNGYNLTTGGNENSGDSIYTLNKKSINHQKYSKGLPRFMTTRPMVKRTVFVIRKHPNCKYRQFDNKLECLEYLLEITDNEEEKITITKTYIDAQTNIKPKTGIFRRSGFKYPDETDNDSNDKKEERPETNVAVGEQVSNDA
jgi:hypothetical protein